MNKQSLVLVLGLTAVASLIASADIVVINNADTGAGSLRQAINDAAPGSTITFNNALSGQTILLTSGQLVVNKNLTIDGSALLIGIDIQNSSDRMFQINAGAEVILDSLTLSHGNCPSAGGAILNLGGTLTLSRCTLADNTAWFDGGGGAIFNDVGSTLTLTQCTLTGNHASEQGGAIYNYTPATLTVVECTISGNTSDGFPSFRGGLGGGGIFNAGVLNLSNTIVAGNADPHAPNISGSLNGNNNLTAGDPLLSPLGDYGGPTLTMPPLAGSPAIDAGGTSTFPTDQRGLARVFGPALDIGAVEVQPGTFPNPDTPCPGSPNQITLYNENFNGVRLGSSFDETPQTPNVWARIPPTGWTSDRSGVPGISSLATDGVSEWAGWAFAEATWWSQLAPTNSRDLFTNASGTILVADGQRWSRISHTPAGLMTTLISTPPISLEGVSPGSLDLCFDSSWRPGGTQKALILVSFDGGAPVEVMRWESASFGQYAKPAAPNQHVHVHVDHPPGASSVVFTFKYADAGNDGWWAIDNLTVSGGSKAILITDLRTPDNPPRVELDFRDTLPPLLTNGNPTGVYFVQSSPSLKAGSWQDILTITSPNPTGLYSIELPRTAGSMFYRIAANPGTLNDLDGDGVNNSMETTGWDVLVTNVAGGTSVRRVTSDPLLNDTDGDGISDWDERLRFTDPRNADTDNDFLTDYDEINFYQSNPTKTDTDGDELLDGVEVFIHFTSPVVADTDGDKLTDYEEVNDTLTNPERTRPLISDLPTPLITIVDNSTTIDLDITYSDGSSVESGYSSSFGRSESTALGQSDARSNETALEVSASITAGVEAGFPGGVSASASATLGVAASQTQGRTTTVSVEQTTAVNSEYSNYKSQSSSRTVTTGHGRIGVRFRVSNIGPRAFTISDIEIQARLRDGTLIGTLQPVGSNISLAPGASTAASGLEALLDNVLLSTMEKIYADPTLLKFEVVNFNVTDATGVNMVFLEEDNLNKTFGLTIDYGNGNGVLPPERYRIATETEQGQGGVTLSKALNQPFHAPIPFTVATQSGTGRLVLTSVRGVSFDNSKRAFWVVVTNGVTGSTDDFDNIRLKAGDEVQLLYVRDQDGDGLNDREEFVYGSSDTSSNTDGDGIPDFDEVKTGWMVNATLRNNVTKQYQVFSDPRFGDLDGDGLTDQQERTLATDPRVPDTDGDGVNDNADVQPLVYGAPPSNTLNTPTSNQAVASISGNASSTVPLTSVTINWGDGTSNTVLTPPANTFSFAYSASHTYASSGSKTITSTARNANNLTRVATGNVNVIIGAPRNGLVAEYLFNNFSLSDTSGSARTLGFSQSNSQIVGAADRFGQANRAAWFKNEGVGAGTFYYMTTASTNGWEFDGSAYTVSAWVRKDSGNGGVIVGQNASPALAIWDNKVYFGGWFNGDRVIFAEEPAAVSGWTHYAATISGPASSRTVRLYRNGTQVSLSTKSDPFTYSGNLPGRIGCWADSGTNAEEAYALTNTYVDSVRIYNRVLSASEIGFLMNDNQ